MKLERLNRSVVAWADWSYVVRGSGRALQVLVARTVDGRLALVSADVHVWVGAMGTGDSEDERDCELVGGACRLEGSVILPVIELFDRTHARHAGVNFEQSEEFWQGLEAIFERRWRPHG